MTKYLSTQTVVDALRHLSGTDFNRSGRTAATGYLLLKAKETSPGTWINVTSKGPSSVEPELKRFLRIAPGTLAPDVNPFGTQEGTLEYLAPQYERRGTYTHLYPGRNLSGFLTVQKSGRAFRVQIPEAAAEAVTGLLGRKLPLEPTAAFFMRGESFSDTANRTEVVKRFFDVFHLTPREQAALFEVAPTFRFEFATTLHEDELANLPADLQPKLSTSTHAATARAATKLLPMSSMNTGDLLIDDRLRRRVERAFATSKAIALVGPPGTGKSRILAELLEDASSDPEPLGLKRPPSYLTVTAEMDWTARTIVGGYYPQETGKLVFREGYLLQALKSDQMLWIDEMNRADLDRVLGPVLTFLAGQPVDLGVTHLGNEAVGDRAKKMVLVWGSGVESGCKEDEEQRVYYAGSDWRLIGTYNNVDRGRVFPMGAALQRRWALIPVAPAAISIAKSIIGQANARMPIVDKLVGAYELHQKFLPIGVAPFLDIARYVGESDDDAGAPLTGEEQEHLEDGYVLFLGQQLARLDPEKRKEFFDGLALVFSRELADEAAEF